VYIYINITTSDISLIARREEGIIEGRGVDRRREDREFSGGSHFIEGLTWY
jgi:hypothetical protein